MRTLRKLAAVALFVAVLILGWRFAAENSATVSIHFLLGQIEGVALWAALLAAFGAGAACIGGLLLLRLARIGLVARRYRKVAEGLEAEVHQLRNLPLASTESAIRNPEFELSTRDLLEKGA